MDIMLNASTELLDTVIKAATVFGVSLLLVFTYFLSRGTWDNR